jgi:hypothetical protein
MNATNNNRQVTTLEELNKKIISYSLSTALMHLGPEKSQIYNLKFKDIMTRITVALMKNLSSEEQEELVEEGNKLITELYDELDKIGYKEPSQEDRKLAEIEIKTKVERIEKILILLNLESNIEEVQKLAEDFYVYMTYKTSPNVATDVYLFMLEQKKKLG